MAISFSFLLKKNPLFLCKANKFVLLNKMQSVTPVFSNCDLSLGVPVWMPVCLCNWFVLVKPMGLMVHADPDLEPRAWRNVTCCINAVVCILRREEKSTSFPLFEACVGMCYRPSKCSAWLFKMLAISLGKSCIPFLQWLLSNPVLLDF